MTFQFSQGRALTSASHLGGGLTLAPAFITPRLRQMHQQQARHDNPKFARSLPRAGSVGEFHQTVFGSFQERNHVSR